MEKGKNTGDALTMSTILWYAVFIWFASSLFSQSLYMALNGVPYDALALLKDLGPLYYVVLVVELFVWICIGSLVVKKIAQKAGFGPFTPSPTA